MSRNTLFDRVWDQHIVRQLPDGQTQLFIGLHLIHEVTSPQAFAMLKARGLKVWFPERTFATVDHIVPTDVRTRPFQDALAEQMTRVLEEAAAEHGFIFFGLDDERQGIVHVIGPELGLTQPGMTIACGDSHTSTHGAFGNIAFGIGTTQVANVLASQCLLVERPKVRQIKVIGSLQQGVTAKDVILTIIGRLGVNGGIGYAYEYAGEVIEQMCMEERMTVCNMTIEGGAKCGYVNPDQETVDYLRGRPHAPNGASFERLSRWWLKLASSDDAEYDDVVMIDGTKLEPMVTWGITPGDVVGVTEPIPDKGIYDAYPFMGFRPGQRVLGTKIDVAFIGSCTNSRLADLREVADLICTHNLTVAPHVRALVVPGSESVRRQAEVEGLHEIFRAAGFDWRGAGCSMCLGMNPDKLVGEQVCASSSNRNFKGRQGSPTGRTLLMSPVMVAAAAAAGEVVDVRTLS